jgi:hypothetical protein
MAEPKEVQKVSKVDVKVVPSDREGLLASWVSQSTELAERATVTAFGVVRDVRGEINQRVVLGTLNWIEGVQTGMTKLLRGIDDRFDKLAEDVTDTAENLTLGLIRTIRDTGHGVTELATSITKPREASRAA